MEELTYQRHQCKPRLHPTRPPSPRCSHGCQAQLAIRNCVENETSSASTKTSERGKDSREPVPAIAALSVTGLRSSSASAYKEERRVRIEHERVRR